MPMTAETTAKFEAEERAYWQMRDALLAQDRGKWVAVVGGQVVAVGDQMSKVCAEAYRKTGSKVKFVSLVGEEDIEFVIRSAASGRFVTGPRWELPLVDAGVSDADGDPVYPETFIVDTGADITILTTNIASKIDLWSTPSTTAYIRGVNGPPERRMLYDAQVHLGGQALEVTCDHRDDEPYSLLGRDVINQFSLTVCAKREEVTFEWVD